MKVWEFKLSCDDKKHITFKNRPNANPTYVRRQATNPTDNLFFDNFLEKKDSTCDFFTRFAL